MPDGTWQKTPASFVWSVKDGITQELTVRSVNAWGRTGPPSTVELTWTKGKTK